MSRSGATTGTSRSRIGFTYFMYVLSYMYASVIFRFFLIATAFCESPHSLDGVPEPFQISVLRKLRDAECRRVLVTSNLLVGFTIDISVGWNRAWNRAPSFVGGGCAVEFSLALFLACCCVETHRLEFCMINYKIRVGVVESRF
jgi:hypothetical protein